MGRAVGGELADFTEFDRKNYFYPDIPKGYQISQYKYPLVSGGELSGVSLTRIHLEEDTARSTHKDTHSLIDFNRAGIPLMELVTEPVITTAQEAGTFARELQLLLRYLGAGEANMEKGQMRVEANISVSSSAQRGTKVEVKNLNSFRSVERAIAFEIERQSALLESGEKVVQETRGWDESGGRTFSQRLKEESHDYRYFPDPDLPKLALSEVEEFSPERIKGTLPELPWEKRVRYKEQYGIKTEDIEVYVEHPDTYGILFERTVTALGGDQKLVVLASNYITSDLVGLLREKTDRAEALVETFSDLIMMVGGGEISSRGAKDILVEMVHHGGNPRDIAETKGLFQKSDTGELQEVIDKIILENPKVVAEYKSGKEASLQYLIGQGMKETKGAANPGVLKSLLEASLK